ncbi:hypothetical protein KPB2_5498 [Klebsiella pneumoniae Kb677]|nr:hypothetical protein KPB2_5498 [Klebsiella pneumoniae Kb677]
MPFSQAYGRLCHPPGLAHDVITDPPLAVVVASLAECPSPASGLFDREAPKAVATACTPPQHERLAVYGRLVTSRSFYRRNAITRIGPDRPFGPCARQRDLSTRLKSHL